MYKRGKKEIASFLPGKATALHANIFLRYRNGVDRAEKSGEFFGEGMCAQIKAQGKRDWETDSETDGIPPGLREFQSS